MKLKLHNFRCYSDKEFDFGEDGLLLLSGNSGSGKTTILTAINFVLYGTGTKLPTYGKTSCSVTMEIDGLTITRTKRPNRLVLFDNNSQEEYEDDSAQSIIDQKFGQAFDITSYVQQNAYNSFIMMSPLEKLSFLEKFAFQGIDLTKIKGKCQSYIKKRNEELISSTSRLEMASQYLNDTPKPEKVPFPLKKTLDKEKAIKNEETRLKNTKVLIKKTEKKIEETTEELNNTKVQKVKVENLKSILASLKEKIKEIKINLENTHYEGDVSLVSKEELLQSFLSSKELIKVRENYLQNKTKYEEMAEQELQEIEKKIVEVSSGLWQEYKKEEIDDLIKEYTIIGKDYDRLENLKKEKKRYSIGSLEKYKEDKEKMVKYRILLEKLKLQKNVYKCPNCSCSVRVQENSLVVVGDIIETPEYDIATLEREIKILEKSLQEQTRIYDRLQEIEKEINSIQEQYEEPLTENYIINVDELKKYKLTNLELEKKLTSLKNKTLSSSLCKMKEQLSKDEEKLKKLESKITNTKILQVNEEDLRSTINTEKQKKEKIKLLSTSLQNYENEYKSHSKQLSLYNVEKDEEELQKNLDTFKEELTKHKQDLTTHESNMEKVAVYKKYQEELSKYKEWEEKVKSLTKEENKNRLKYASATQLKEIILRAESIAIQNTIDSINRHAQEYLNLFFPENPITVRLLSFKETKKSSKPQINIEIQYKDMDADISMLSGGELSRVVLAFTLALSEIYNSPIILLDECTASLDQELTGILMEGIKSSFSSRLIIAIAHQVVAGNFDREINL